MTVRSPKGTDEPQTFSLQIAAGVDEATRADYRSRNRLVCFGFGSLHYYSPEEMMEDYYYQAHPDEVRTDYGPKWFLQIAENDVVTVPASDSGPKLFQIGSTATYLLPTYGDEQRQEGVFPVVVSADCNTITVRPIEDNGLWYPSAVTLSRWDDRRNLDVVSDIVLKRTSQPAHAGYTPAERPAGRTPQQARLMDAGRTAAGVSPSAFSTQVHAGTLTLRVPAAELARSRR